METLNKIKITLINGSARNNGSCNYLLETIQKELNLQNYDVKKYCIGTINLHFCLGCKKCYTDGNCVINDDVRSIVEDIVTSDYVVIAAPSYWADVPGQLKTFFDRNTPFGDTNPVRNLVASKQIKGYSIAIRAGVRENENDLLLNAIEHYFGHLGITPVKRISITQTDTLEDLLTKHQDKIEEVKSITKEMKHE